MTRIGYVCDKPIPLGRKCDGLGEILDPYIQTVGELKIKLRGIRKQFRKQNRHSPIEFVTGRVKSVKVSRKNGAARIKPENIEQDLQDIAGLRIMVQFVDDVDEVLALLRSRQI